MDAARTVLTPSCSFDTRNDAFFVDYDLIPLVIMDNYGTGCKDIESMSAAGRLLSDISLYERSIRMDQVITIKNNRIGSYYRLLVYCIVECA